jgi:hypothetical protein
MAEAGYNMTIQIDTGGGLETLCVTTATIKEVVVDLPTNSNCGGKFGTRTTGKTNLEITIEGNWEAGGTGDPPDINAGDICDMSGDIGKAFTGSFVLFDVMCKGDANGLLTYSFTGKSTGPYTYTN